MGKQLQPQWSNRDIALLGTCQVLSTLQHEQAPQPVAPIPASLAPQLGTGERLLAAGPFMLLEFTAPGDGSYDQSSGFAIGSPVFMGAFFATQALSNNHRRKQAEANAQMRWMPVEQGNLIVSTHGVYFETPRGLLTWDWEAIHQGEMMAPRQFMMAGQSEQGPVRYIIDSDWAELVFVLWALHRHPQHPQLGQANWLPPGWPQFAQGQGHQLPPLLA